MTQPVHRSKSPTVILAVFVQSLWLWPSLRSTNTGYLSPMFTAANIIESVNVQQPRIINSIHGTISWEVNSHLEAIDFIWCLLVQKKTTSTWPGLCPQYWFAQGSITIRMLARVFSISLEVTKSFATPAVYSGDDRTEPVNPRAASNTQKRQNHLKTIKRLELHQMCPLTAWS